MIERTVREIVRAYYLAWSAQDRDVVRRLLDDRLSFRSPQDRFDSADAFLSACWRYSEGLTGVRFARELYDSDRAFVVLWWVGEGDSAFADAEYVEVADGRIRRIVVLNNDPAFGEMIPWGP